MPWDDDTPKPQPTIRVGEPLDPVSFRDLEARIMDLEAEIERTRIEIDRKKKHQAAAANLFK